MKSLTPAQRRGLMLLARPGAVAEQSRTIRWRVFADGNEVGTIHAESLLALRILGLVEMAGAPFSLNDWHQRITPKGRALAASWSEVAP